MKINPNALALYAFMYLVGYLLGGSHCGLVFLTAGLGLSVLSAMVSR